MSRRRHAGTNQLGFALAVAGFLAAGSAGAQMYKCTGADGKTSFSDRPCAEAGAKQQVQAATLGQQAARMGLSARYVGHLQNECGSGNPESCQALDDIKAGPAPEGNPQEFMRRWSVDSQKLETLREACKKGDNVTCLRYERMKRSTPQQEAKERQARLTKACSAGSRDACREVDPDFGAREVAQERAEQRRRALENYGAKCRQGDADACAAVEKLNKTR